MPEEFRNCKIYEEQKCLDDFFTRSKDVLYFSFQNRYMFKSVLELIDRNFIRSYLINILYIFLL